MENETLDNIIDDLQATMGEKTDGIDIETKITLGKIADNIS